METHSLITLFPCHLPFCHPTCQLPTHLIDFEVKNDNLTKFYFRFTCLVQILLVKNRNKKILKTNKTKE